MACSRSLGQGPGAKGVIRYLWEHIASQSFPYFRATRLFPGRHPCSAARSESSLGGYHPEVPPPRDVPPPASQSSLGGANPRTPTDQEGPAQLTEQKGSRQSPNSERAFLLLSQLLVLGDRLRKETTQDRTSHISPVSRGALGKRRWIRTLRIRSESPSGGARPPRGRKLSQKQDSRLHPATNGAVRLAQSATVSMTPHVA